MKIRFVNRGTGEEGKAGEDYSLAMDDEGDVWEFGEESFWPRPDLRAEIVPDWIPVGERLPEWGQFVRVALDSGEEDVMASDESDNGDVWWFHRGDEECTVDIERVTHWMPLPSAEVGP